MGFMWGFSDSIRSDTLATSSLTILALCSEDTRSCSPQRPLPLSKQAFVCTPRVLSLIDNISFSSNAHAGGLWRSCAVFQIAVLNVLNHDTMLPGYPKYMNPSSFLRPVVLMMPCGSREPIILQKIQSLEGGVYC